MLVVNLIRKRYQEHFKEGEKKLGKYKPDPESFKEYIEYSFRTPGKTMTYKGYKEFTKKRKEEGRCQ